MKKLIFLLLLTVVVSGILPAQNQKVTFSLTNYRDSAGKFMVDLMATIPSGKFWAVGASNIRVNFVTTPTNMLTVQADNPAVNANPNISNANGYNAMTTTSVASGAAIGANILTFITQGFYRFNPGTYRLCTLRWTRLGGTQNTQLTFRVPPQQFPTTVADSLVALDTNGYKWINPIITYNNLVSTEVPKDYALYQNYPNPFNPVTNIKYDLPQNSFVSIKVYDVTGKLVDVLINENLTAGRYEVVWNASPYASGVYFYRIEAGDFKQTKKMLLIK